MGVWSYVLMALNMVVFWGLLITAVVLLVLYLSGQRRQSTQAGGSDPERVLAERYAGGEIDDEEYQRRYATLRCVGQPCGARKLGSGP